MSATRVLAVARRIAQGFRRDERTLGLMFVVPIVVTALLGWVIGNEGAQTIRIGVYPPNGQLDQGLIQAIRAGTTARSDELDVELESETADDLDELRGWVRDGRIDLGIGLPGLQFGGGPIITVITEGTDPAADDARLGALQTLLIRVVNVGPREHLPTIHHETVFLSPDAGSLDVLAPVFLGYFGYFFVFLLTGISFLRERVGGTLERLLATPVTRSEIVLGYSLGFGLFATIQVIVLTVFVLARVDVPAIGPIPAFTIGLGIQTAGSAAVAFLIALVLSLGAVNLGIFLSTFARTELQIIQFIPLVIVPQGLLGGIFWPVDRLPDVLQVVARALPMTYAVDGLREVMLKGADLGSAAVRGDLAVLAGIALFFVVLATRTIKREVA